MTEEHKYEKNKYLVKWADEDELYTVSCNEEPESNLMAPDKAVQYMKSLIEDSSKQTI